MLTESSTMLVITRTFPTVEVYAFDGLCDEVVSLGPADINFLRAKLSNLVVIWGLLEGMLAMTCQSKLYLGIILENTTGSNVAEEYSSRMEEEVGKKINLRYLQTNSAFQKIFGLQHENFPINNCTCHPKRKIHMHGLLFLAARLIGFHVNLLGNKAKVFFLCRFVGHFCKQCIGSLEDKIETKGVALLRTHNGLWQSRKTKGERESELAWEIRGKVC